MGERKDIHGKGIGNTLRSEYMLRSTVPVHQLYLPEDSERVDRFLAYGESSILSQGTV